MLLLQMCQRMPLVFQFNGEKDTMIYNCDVVNKNYDKMYSTIPISK